MKMTKKDVHEVCKLGMIFFLGCSASMATLLIAMSRFGDTTASISVIEGTAVYYLIPVAVLVFVGFLTMERAP